MQKMYCKVPDCKNTNNGIVGKIHMCYLPQQPDRRRVWLKNTGITVDLPKSAICEFHFTPDQWERTRIDGTRKLKSSAIPTVFGEDAVRAKDRRGRPPLPSSEIDSPKEKHLNKVGILVRSRRSIAAPSKEKNLHESNVSLPPCYTEAIATITQNDEQDKMSRG